MSYVSVISGHRKTADLAVSTHFAVHRYSEFFPTDLLSFSYNESLAQEHEPLTKEEALARDYRWQDHEPRNYEITKRSEELPDHIKDIPNSITQEIIQCAHF